VIVDAHHHLWDPAARRHAWLDELPALRKPFGISDFENVSAPEEVGASVLIQVLASPAETAEFLAVAADSTVVAGVVGWADLTRPDVAEELVRLRSVPGGDRLVGIRHLVQDEPDPRWLLRPDVRAGLRAVGAAGLVYDLLVRPAQLPAATDVVGELDDVKFVLDHGAKPEIASGRLEPWARQIGELANRPNVSCKLSGLVTEAGAGWTSRQLAPYVDRLLECFGPARLMFGSDWPVCTLAAGYHDVLATARELAGSRLSPREMAAVFAGNAAAIYGLHPAADSP
jgi:L-fuconolactonase